MSFEVDTAFVEQYKDAIRIYSQQKTSRLRMCCEEESVTGRTFYCDAISATAGQDIEERHGDTPLNSTPHDRRRGTMVDWDWADLVDEMDKLKMIADPESKYVRNAVMAANRRIDKHIYTALGAAVAKGQSGATTVNHYDVGECRIIDSAGDLVAAGSAVADDTETALTIAKLLLVKQVLDEGEIDPERQRYFVTNPYNITQLLNTTEVKSADYNTVKALAEGHIDTFMGFKFITLVDFVDASKGIIQTNTTDVAAANCYAFAHGAVTLGVGKDITVSIDKRSDKRNSWQAYVRHSFGAVRNEGPAVVQILLKQSA